MTKITAIQKSMFNSIEDIKDRNMDLKREISELQKEYAENEAYIKQMIDQYKTLTGVVYDPDLALESDLVTISEPKKGKGSKQAEQPAQVNTPADYDLRWKIVKKLVYAFEKNSGSLNKTELVEYMSKIDPQLSSDSVALNFYSLINRGIIKKSADYGGKATLVAGEVEKAKTKKVATKKK